MIHSTKIPEFQKKRFVHRFNEFSKIGQSDSGAMNRPFGSDADIEAREWLKSLARSAGFEVSVDPIGNIWCSFDGISKSPAIVVGSHHDSVPNGGRYDGPLGVLMAIEVMQTIHESGYRNVHPFTVVSFTAEEPNPFDLSTMGSRTVAGRLKAEKLFAARDWNGRLLAEAITAAGGDLRQVASARKYASDIAAFIELHIEQGRRLEQSEASIGVVSGICGIYRESVTVQGEANHAGTTQLQDRRDALLASSEMLLYIEDALKRLNNPEVIATVGRLSVSPNAVNIVPERCEWSLEIRGGNMEHVYELRDHLQKGFEDVAQKRQVRVKRDLLLDQQPEPMDQGIINILQETSQNLGIQYRDLASMAGHDATHIASFTRAGMIFVPSIGGKSHCKEEETHIEDIEHSYYVLAGAVLALDKE